LVVIGSLRTERDYLVGLRDSARTRAVDIHIVHKAKSPREVVAHAAALAIRSTDEFDEVWCVFDVDHFEVEPAIREARRTGLELAVSDPCFELWYCSTTRTAAPSRTATRTSYVACRSMSPAMTRRSWPSPTTHAEW
jgi:hypothetical protein